MIGSIIALTVCRFFAAAFHTFGFYLLYKTRSSKFSRGQRLHLMNFSLSEILLCVFDGVRRICQLTGAENVFTYILIFQWTGLSLGYYLAMILLTVDRFFEFFLNIQYATYWTEQRTKYSIGISWIINILFGVISLMTMPNNAEKVSELTTVYFFTPFDVTFILIAFLSYGYLFKTLQHMKMQRQRSTPSTEASSPVTSPLNGEPKYTPRGSKRKAIRAKTTINVLFIPSWIIATYLIFITVPDQIYFYHYVLNKVPEETWHEIIGFMYCFGFISDAMIYIFLSPAVRNTLLRLIVRNKMKWLMK